MADETEVQVLENVPNDKVPQKVAQMMRSAGYESLKVVPDSPTTSRIELTVRT